MTPISRHEAFLIADSTRVEQDLGISIRHVLLLEELKSRIPCMYNIDLNNCWIAYVEKNFQGLCSSTVIVIDRYTGKVRGYGSANDEG